MAEVSEQGKPAKEGKVRSKKSSTRIDMTPMVDLAFLLLTFFMLTTTFTKPQTMEITMPEKPKEDTELPLVNEKKVLTLILDEKDQIYWFVGITDPKIDVTDYSSEGIRKVLLTQNSQLKDMVVLIKPTDKSNYKNMVDILDEMEISAIGRFALVDVTPEDLTLIHPPSNLSKL
uniref:Biopolymer transporter ExbD n=1 Tax=Roseihalotalea indica TaxID=2867963 RepID=A0AA49GN03_9BACT|nr:biopolymer transporter ExbD [Tunicatimonas sp. TK19036]